MIQQASDADYGNLEKYEVIMVCTEEIKPSPENDEIYGEIVHDEQMDALIQSIRKRGLEEPILIDEDGNIISGHRRYYACDCLGKRLIPCRVNRLVRRATCDNWHSVLTEYNPQRVKTVSSLLREALLRDQSPTDTYEAVRAHHEASLKVDADFMEVAGIKDIRPVSKAKTPFLESVQDVVNGLEKFWPLSIRQIHYNLLNDPPLISTFRRTKFSAESHRYKNDKRSYTALVRLLSSARYHGHISMSIIDDPTRPQMLHEGFDSVSQFVQQAIDRFLVGYHRDRQKDQSRHIEIFAEKNTVYSVLKNVSIEYYVDMVAGRGFCSIPVWRDMAERFKRSGKEAMSLIIVSDYDPEGFALADDAIRTLRDCWGVPVDGHRVGVTREQIDELNLASDFNPAKQDSTNINSFRERTGGDQSWELEALPPDYLIDQVKSAIESNMDMEIFRKVIEQEKQDCEELFKCKQTIAGDMKL